MLEIVLALVVFILWFFLPEGKFAREKDELTTEPPGEREIR